MKKVRGIAAILALAGSFLLAGCFLIILLLADVYGGGDSWQHSGDMSLKTSQNETMTVKDVFFGLQKESKGRAVSDEYTAELHGNMTSPDTTSLSYAGTVEDIGGNTLQSIVKDSGTPANTMTLELTYDKSSDTLAGDVEFTYNSKIYTGTSSFTRIE
jgi:hypothetical protein